MIGARLQRITAVLPPAVAAQKHMCDLHNDDARQAGGGRL